MSDLVPARPSGGVAAVDPDSATATEIRDWSIAIRDRIPDMTEDQLNQVEALLIALRTRLRQLNEDIAETERSRILAWQRKGQLLPPPEQTKGQRSDLLENHKKSSSSDWQDRHRARLLAAYPEVVEKALQEKKPSLNKTVNLCKRQRAAEDATKVAQQMAEAIIVDADDSGDVQPSKWWQLGDHLLYCGDSSDQEFIDQAKAARLAFADPPYNADKADWDHGFVWHHDYLTDVADVAVVTPGISAIADFFRVTQMPYRWSIAAHISNGMTRGALGFGNWIYVAAFSKLDSIHRNAQDHITITVDASTTHEAAHESRKPVRLLIDLIELFTDEGDLVIDPFLGSGTTLFAAEQAGRRCVGAEVNPKFQAEIIARWGPEARPL